MAISDAQYIAWLKQDDRQRVILVEANYFDGAVERTAYLGSVPYLSQPWDIPANQPYDDVVMATPQFSCALSDALEGYTVPSWGNVVIGNSDFSRDIWLTYAWDGRSVTILFGDVNWARSDFRPILTGTIDGISAQSSTQINMSIKDKQWLLNAPIQTELVGSPVWLFGNTYQVSAVAVNSIDFVWDNGVLLDPSAYTTSPLTNPATFTLNAPAAGLVLAEFTGGTAATGQVVPLCYGEVFNLTPVVLSVPGLLFQVHGGAIQAILEVRDGGIPIAFTANLAQGQFTLLSKPAGVVTCDVQGATLGGVFVEGVGRIMRYILLTQTGFPGDNDPANPTSQVAFTVNDLDNDSLSAFASICSQRVGIYINSRRNTLDVLDELIKSVGGFYTPNRIGKLLFGRIDTVAGIPVLALTADDLVFGGLKVIKQSIPWMTARAVYGKNYTPQTTLHGAVTNDQIILYAQPWQYVSRGNPSIKVMHLMAPTPIEKQTDLVDRTEATAEVTRLLALNGVVHTTYSAECAILPLTINMGDVVQMTHPRYGLQNGRLMIVVGINENVVNRRVILTLRD